MALRSCRECGRKVSTATATYTGCGVTNPSGTREGWRAAQDARGSPPGQGVFDEIVVVIVAPMVLAAVCLLLYLWVAFVR